MKLQITDKGRERPPVSWQKLRHVDITDKQLTALKEGKTVAVKSGAEKLVAIGYCNEAKKAPDPVGDKSAESK